MIECDGNNFLTLAPLTASQLSSSNAKESTIFEQVYSGPRRRPAMISLNVQWVPVQNHSGAYHWSTNDANNRKVKTVTFFGTGEMRGQTKPKAVTPPSSDYTDAYLSTFSAKPIPTKHVNRLSTAIFANAAPIPLKPMSPPLSRASPVPTSQTRFVNVNMTGPSPSIDKTPLSSSSRSSTYSSSFASEKSTPYEPFSSTQYSTPQSQTFTSSYSTLLRTPTSTVSNAPSPSIESQRSYSTTQNQYLPTLPTFTSFSRTETPYNNLYKPLPPYSLQSYPPSNTYTTSLPSSTSSTYSSESTYKPSVVSQSTSLSSSYNFNQSTVPKPTIPITSNIQNQTDRPETLLFQHDEDLRSSSRIEKPSPIFTPTQESPVKREELKIEPEHLQMEELSAPSSEPISILESTLEKYDSLINQISEVLASVSPLSSTLSSMSPGKSALDYDISSDGSPILPTKRIHEQSTTTITQSDIAQPEKSSHIIRQDSFDKIVNAMSDIDKEIAASSDIASSASIITQENAQPNLSTVDQLQVQPSTSENVTTSIVQSVDESHAPLETKQQEEEQDVKILVSDELQTAPILEEKVEVTQQTSPESLEQPTALVVEEVKIEQALSSTADNQEDRQPTDASIVTEPESKEAEIAFTEEPQVSSISTEQKLEEIEAIKTLPIESEEGKGQKEVSSSEQQQEKEIKPETAEEQQAPVAISKEIEDVQASLIEEQQVSLISTEQKLEEIEAIKTLPIESEEGKSQTEVSSSERQQEKEIQPETAEEQQAKEIQPETAEEQQAPAAIPKETEDVKPSLIEEQQVSSISSEQKGDEQQDHEPKTTTAEEEQTSTVSAEQREDEVKVLSADEQQAIPVTEETKPSVADVQETQIVTTSADENKEEPQSLSSEEVQITSSVAEEKVKAETTSATEDQLSSASEITHEETKVLPADELEALSTVSVETALKSEQPKVDEEKITSEQLTIEATSEDAELSTDEASDLQAIKKSGKRVTWDETVVDNEDDESSSLESALEENSTSESLATASSEESSAAAPTETEINAVQITISSDSTETPAALLSTNDVQATASEEQIVASDSTEQQARASSPTEKLSISTDSISQEMTASDLSESQLNFPEQQVGSISPTDSQSISNTDSSKEDTFTVDEISTTISDIISNEDISKVVEESKEEVTTDLEKVDTSSTATEQISDEHKVEIIEASTTSLQPIIVTPIDALPEEVSTRFISSDVYHGYLGQHNQFSQDLSDVDNESATKSLIASLRETIVAPLTPLLESIQSVVSSVQTTTLIHPSKVEGESTEHAQEDTSLTAAAVQESQTDISSDETHVEEAKPTTDRPEESKPVLENVGETIPATTETSKEIEEHSSSLLGHIQENLSKTISTLTERIHNVISTGASSTNIHTEPEQTLQQEQLESKPVEESVSSDTTEQINEQNEKQETMPIESSPTETQESTIVTETPEEPKAESVEMAPVTQHDEQVLISKDENKIDDSLPTSTSQSDEQKLTSISTTPEPINTEDNEVLKIQEITPIDRQTEGTEAVEDKTDESLVSTTAIDEKESVPVTTSTPLEQQDTVVTQEVLKDETETSEKPSEISIEQPLDTDVSTETKTTIEVTQGAITDPITTLAETIQNLITSSAAEEVSLTREQIKQEDITTSFETPQGTLVNPIATVNETIQDAVSNLNDQTSSYQEHEQILAKQESDTYLQDQFPDTTETGVTTIITSETSGNETPIQMQVVETEPATDGDTQYQSVTYITQISPVDETTSDKNEAIGDIVQDIINDSINQVVFQMSLTPIDPEQIERERLFSGSGLTSPITVINVEDRSEGSQATVTQDTLTNEDNIVDSQISTSEITWENLVGEQSAGSIVQSSLQEMKQLLEEVVQSSDKIAVEIIESVTTITLPSQTQSTPVLETTTQEISIKPQVDEIVTSLTNNLELDLKSEIKQGIENISSQLSAEFREESPENTEDDSLELIHALHGHSIAQASGILPQTEMTVHQSSTSSSVIEKLDVQGVNVPEKSSSSTTSSQITSSDRYVSYAIHEMGDSSQERLPAILLAADMPVYESAKTTSDENKERQISPEPNVNINPNINKDDDLTEFDATENLTCSDDILMQKLYASAPNREQNLDASSTDEDVDDENFNEYENNDVSNLYRIFHEVTRQNDPAFQELGQAYQRYDVSTSSSISTKPPTEDVYIIPGYSGLWKPSADDDESVDSPSGNDADEEDNKQSSTGTSTVKTRTIIRTTDPAKLQSFLQQQNISVQPDTIDVFNRPLNEFSFDVSESDSFKTCQSTINSSSVASKQCKQSEIIDIPIPEEQERQVSPDEKIFLIRERERGVSLPVTMKIDYDNMALRLTASTPLDVPLFSTTETTDFPSPSTHSEPMQQTTSSSRASTPSLSSSEGEKHKFPSSSWLNTVNTVTTVIDGPDGPLESRTTIHKSAKGPISVAECDAQGKYIVIENTSRSKSIVLTGWTLRQESEHGDILKFTFPENCLLRPNHSFKIFTKANESERKNSDIVASSVSAWYTGSNFVTTLINAEGKDRASLTKKTVFS